MDILYTALWSWTFEHVHTHTHNISTDIHTSLKTPRDAHKKTRVSNIWDLESFACSVVFLCVHVCLRALPCHTNSYSRHTACAPVYIYTWASACLRRFQQLLLHPGFIIKHNCYSPLWLFTPVGNIKNDTQHPLKSQGSHFKLLQWLWNCSFLPVTQSDCTHGSICNMRCYTLL